MSLSFKTNHPTGKYRSFSHISIDIKLNKQEVGQIVWHWGTWPTVASDGMRVSLRVKDDKSSCGWKNITLAMIFEGFTDKEQGTAAKKWVTENWEAITKKYAIHPLTEQPSML